MNDDPIKLNLKIAHYIFVFLMGGQFLLVIFAYFLLAGRAGVTFFNEAASGTFLFQLLPFLTLGLAILAFFIGKKRAEKGKRLKSEELKIHHFRDTAIMQAVMMEGANLFAVMVGILTFSYLPFVFFAFGLIVFLFFYPSENRFRNEYF